MTPATCRALALSSPCTFADAVDNGRAVLMHSRDPSSAANTTVQLIKGVAQFQCDADGNAAVLVYPILVGGLLTLGANSGADSWGSIPGASATAGVTARYRVIAMEADYSCMASNMLNAGSMYAACLDPGMGEVDYRSEALNTLASRTTALRNFIDDRPRGSYAAQAAKDTTKIVFSRQSAEAIRTPFVGGLNVTPVVVSTSGDAFKFPAAWASNLLWGQQTPVVMNLRVADLEPTGAFVIQGAAANMPFQIQTCMLVELVPASTVMSTNPGLAAGAAGLSGVVNKIASNVTIGGVEKAEHYAERGLEGALTLAGYAGVPGASAGAGLLHVGQSGLESFEHSRLGHALHLG